MREQEVFVMADQALCDVVDRIGDDQWATGLPRWFKANAAQRDLDLRRIINYHAYDDAWVPDVLAGRTMAEVGSRHDGDLLGADPKTAFRAIAERAVEAVWALATARRRSTSATAPTRPASTSSTSRASGASGSTSFRS